jgi:hypothetical protein
MAGRYVAAFSWHLDIECFLNEVVIERPLLHVCSGPESEFGDVRADRYVIPKAPGIVADWTQLPFADDSFAAVFADPPWHLGYMQQCANFCKDALQIAPVVYVMSPWLWVERRAERKIWVREFPGINQPILLVRYERKNRNQMSLFSEWKNGE